MVVAIITITSFTNSSFGGGLIFPGHSRSVGLKVGRKPQILGKNKINPTTQQSRQVGSKENTGKGGERGISSPLTWAPGGAKCLLQKWGLGCHSLKL